jgi:hypothetical protein
MDTQLKPHYLHQEPNQRRDAQGRRFHRNQALGLLLAAGAVLAWRLLPTPSGWLFPQGWWRLW